jgi:hypothetical protein
MPTGSSLKSYLDKPKSLLETYFTHAYNRAFKDAFLYIPILGPVQHICLYSMLIIKPLKCLLTYAYNKDRKFPSTNSYNSNDLHLLHSL